MAKKSCERILYSSFLTNSLVCIFLVRGGQFAAGFKCVTTKEKYIQANSTIGRVLWQGKFK